MSDGSVWASVGASDAPFEGRIDHSVIVDSVRGRLVLFGGQSASGQPLDDVYASALDQPGEWVDLLPFASPSLRRWGHSAIYDPPRDRMLIFGGVRDSLLNDVWSLSFAGQPTWTQLAVTGDSPPPQAFHAAIYDPTQERMLVFGGIDSDVWALDLVGGGGWSKIQPSGSELPPSRWGHTAVYVPTLPAMAVFGGSADSGTFLNDVWLLQLGAAPAWSRLNLPAPGPDPRTEHGAAFDLSRNRMIVYGGFSFGTANDTWELDFVEAPEWRLLSPGPSPPPARNGASLTFDADGNRMVLFGGQGVSGPRNDTWAVPTASQPSWSRIADSGQQPSPSGGHSAVYDSRRRRLLVFGGSGQNDTWALNLLTDTWEEVATSSRPSPRYEHSAIYDSARDRMVIFGGFAFQPLNDVWALSFDPAATWTQINPLGPLPSARTGHTAVYDSVADRMLVYGGSSENLLWALAFDSEPQWSVVPTIGLEPPLSTSHTAHLDTSRRMTVFGGGFLRDLWTVSFDEGSARWERASVLGSPPVAWQAVASGYDVERDGTMFFGGSAGGTMLAETKWLHLPATTDVSPTAPADGNGRLIRAVWPSPARARMTASIELADYGDVQVSIYDVAGRSIRTFPCISMAIGLHDVEWDLRDSSGRRVPSGAYIWRVASGGRTEAARIVVVP